MRLLFALALTSTQRLVLPVHHQRSIVAVRRIFFCNKSTP